MEKFQSLADFLGVRDPIRPEAPIQPAPSRKLTAKAFAKDILDTVQYRESLLRRILVGDLPPAVECLLYHYAYGKPVEQLEVKDTTNRIEDMTVEQLETRAMVLVEVARKIRASSGDSSGVMH